MSRDLKFLKDTQKSDKSLQGSLGCQCFLYNHSCKSFLKKCMAVVQQNLARSIILKFFVTLTRRKAKLENTNATGRFRKIWGFSSTNACFWKLFNSKNLGLSVALNHLMRVSIVDFSSSIKSSAKATSIENPHGGIFHLHHSNLIKKGNVFLNKMIRRSNLFRILLKAPEHRNFWNV